MKSKFKNQEVQEQAVQGQVQEQKIIESTPFKEVPLSQVEGLVKEGYKCVGSYLKDGKKVYKMVKENNE